MSLLEAERRSEACYFAKAYAPSESPHKAADSSLAACGKDTWHTRISCTHKTRLFPRLLSAAALCRILHYSRHIWSIARLPAQVNST